MRQSRALWGGRVLSYFTLFLVIAIYCFLLHIPEMISFIVSFPVVIIKGDCQLVHGIERSGFALFPVCYQILKVIWQPLIETMAENWITLVQLCCVPHKFHIISGNLISWLHTEVANEIGSILYWVQESKIDPEFIYKKLPSRKLRLWIAKVFLL